MSISCNEHSDPNVGENEKINRTPISETNSVKQTSQELLRQTLSDRLQSQLHGIATVRVLPYSEGEYKDREVLQIDVTDPVRWRSPENIRSMLPFIGSILQQTFNPKNADTPLSPDDLYNEYQDSDIKYTDKMIILAKNQQVQGFTMLKDCGLTKTNKIPVTAVQLISVEAGQKYAGSGKLLYRLIEENGPDTALVAATHTPAAIVALTKSISPDTRCYFCGERIDAHQTTSTKEETLIREVEQQYKLMLSTDYDAFLKQIDQSGIPPHCLTYGTESITWKDEHQWAPEDHSHAANLFRKLRKWVVNNGRANEGIYGMLMTLPKSAL